MSRTRMHLFLLTSFFGFAFALMFVALVQNYAQAGAVSSVSSHDILSPTDTHVMEDTILPTYNGFEQKDPSFDFDSDASFQKYLNPDHPFQDDSYEPSDLIAIDSHFTANNSAKFQLRKEAAVHFADMARHFRHDFSGDRLAIVSTYRSRGLQDYLIKQGCTLVRCAPTGTSEHQAGLALDLRVVARGGRSYSLDAGSPNKYSERLKANAAEFGFHNTYQKGVKIDGKMAEGRHRRYLGIPLATILANTHQTLAEYYSSIKN